MNVNITLTAENGQLVATFAGTAKIAKDFGDKVERAGRQTGAAARAQDRLAESTKRVGQSFWQAHGHHLKYAALLGTPYALKRYADAQTNLSNRLRLVTQSETQLIRTRQDLLRISLDTRTAIEANANLYSRLALAAGDTGHSQGQLLQVTRLLNQQVAIGGNTASEAANGLVQFAQGVASGRLQGDELRSVLENLQGVSQGLLVGFRRLRREGQIDFDVTRGNIRKLAADGLLSSKLLLDAVLASADDTEAKFSQVNATLGGAFTNLGTAVQALVGSVDQASGASATLVRHLNLLAEGKLDEGFWLLNEAVYALGAVSLGRYLVNANIAGRVTSKLASVTAAYRSTAFTVPQLLAQWNLHLRGQSTAMVRLAARQRALNAATRGFVAAGRGVRALLGGWPGLLLLAGVGIWQYISSLDGAADAEGRLAQALKRRREEQEKSGQITSEQSRRLESYSASVTRRIRERESREEAGFAPTQDRQLQDLQNKLLTARQSNTGARERAVELGTRDLPRLGQVTGVYNYGYTAEARRYTADDLARDQKQIADDLREAAKHIKQTDEDIEELEQQIADRQAALAEARPARAPASARAIIDAYLPKTEQIKAEADARIKELLAAKERMQKEAAKTGGYSAGYYRDLLDINRTIARIGKERDEKLKTATPEGRAAEAEERERAARRLRVRQRVLDRYAPQQGAVERYKEELAAIEKLQEEGVLKGQALEDAGYEASLARHRRQADAELEIYRQKWERRLLVQQGYLDEEASAAEEARVRQRLAEDDLEKRRIDQDDNYSETVKSVLKKRVDLERQTGAERVQTQLSIGKDLFAAFAGHSKKAFRAYQALAITEAVISTYRGAAKALAEGGPYLGPVLAAIQVAAGLQQVAQIRAQKQPSGFRRGGIVEGMTHFGYQRERQAPRLGFAGEAGAEAILPVFRGPGGIHGVKSFEGGARQQARNVSNVTVAPVVQVTVAGDAADGGAIGEAAAAQVVEIVQAALVEEQRPGGLLNRV